MPVLENAGPSSGRAGGEAAGILSEVSFTSLSLLPLRASEVYELSLERLLCPIQDQTRAVEPRWRATPDRRQRPK